jgi:hypothetical protein
MTTASKINFRSTTRKQGVTTPRSVWDTPLLAAGFFIKNLSLNSTTVGTIEKNPTIDTQKHGENANLLTYAHFVPP